MTRLKRTIGSFRQFADLTTRRWRPTALLVVLLLVLSVDNPPPMSMEARVDRELTGSQFDFFSWELGAVWRKLTHGLLDPQRAMSEQARRDFLLDYLAIVGEARRVDEEIRKLYVETDAVDPGSASTDLQARREELRDQIRSRQALAEAILEEQVACVLADEGFGALGQEIPPVSMHFTPLPQLLVVSPRDRIERAYQLNLIHGLSTAHRETIEDRIDTTFDVSSLITGIGGLSAYPSMLLESSSVNWVTEVTAHEWTHHYLLPRPLGWHYLSSGETRTINETVASIVGKEVGRRIVARYYPEYLPPEEELPTESSGTEPGEPPAFDFRMEMRETRVRVDGLLAEGKIDEAEAYMEERRQVFVEHGYAIRKLNQAYFAFHGAYADQPGAAGDDPIGPAVREVYARSPDLYTFVNWLASVTTLEELERLVEDLPQGASLQRTSSDSSGADSTS